MNSAQQDVGNPYESFGTTVAHAPADARTTFIRKTYVHLAAAIYAFAALEWALFQLIPEQTMQKSVEWLWGGFFNKLIFFGSFIAVGHIADRWARSDTSRGMQYAGLLLCVAAWAIYFLPMLFIAKFYGGGVNVIGTASLITLIIFGGLTAAVFVTGKDFSFLRTGLFVSMCAAGGLILCSMLFGLHLGVLFTVGMVVLACGYILYYTSNVLHHYRTDQYVAASLALFAAVALLFWFVLQLVMNRD